MATKLPLKVCSLPNGRNDLALSNKLFLNTEDFRSLTRGSAETERFVMVKDTVYTIEEMASTAKGTVPMSAVIRGFLEFGFNDTANLSPYVSTDNRIYLLKVTIEVDYVQKTRKNDEFKSEDIAKRVLSVLAGQYLTVNQLLVIDVATVNLSLKVKLCEVVDLSQFATTAGDDEKQPASDPKAQRGILHASTSVQFVKAPGSLLSITGTAAADGGGLFRPDWKFEDLQIGGLTQEFSDIFRRAFASRIYPKEIIRKLNIQHVKGILLYGPPGTGKTLMARQIGKMLNGKEPKVVNGPSILDKYVGGSEKNVRDLFADAIKEQKEREDQSDLHIIVLDELDAICRQRGSRNDGTGVGDTVVNQILSMMDGVNQLNNILVIGMTNRKDMIDVALLRPGRFEVHMEISLPDEKGRLEILKIHTSALRETKTLADDVDLAQIAAETKNFSGAEILGLVKAAESYALNRNLDVSSGVKLKSTSILVNNADFKMARGEVNAQFGTDDRDFENCQRNGIILFGDRVSRLLNDGALFVHQVKNSNRTPLVSLLLEGAVGSGKTALAAKLATESGYPYVKLISPESLVGLSELGKCSKITNIFEDSYRSPISCIVVDDIERLLDYVRIGPRFSNAVLQTLLVLLKKEPPKGRRLLILTTTSNKRVLEDLELLDVFNASLHIPQISTPEEFRAVLKTLKMFDDSMMETAVNSFASPISIKKLIMLAEMSRQNASGSVVSRFVQAMQDFNA